MAAIGRDANNNMYPISMAVVEAETKDNWSWFLEALLADLGPSGVLRWTFILDWQKASFHLCFLCWTFHSRLCGIFLCV
jgi:hypothetical protein